MTTNDDENQQKSVFVDDVHQKELNRPLAVQGGLKQENKEFLESIMELINSKRVNLYVPHTLVNDAVYNTLDEKRQGEVDIEAVNTLSAMRQIKDLYLAGYSDTYQMENFVDKLRLTKEKFEKEYGDVFII